MRTHTHSEGLYSFRVKKHPFRPTKFPHLSLKINLFFRTKVSSYLINQDSGVALRHLPILSSYATTSPASAHAIVRERLCYYAIRDAVEKVIRDHLQGDKLSQARLGTGVRGYESICRHAIKPVWDKVLRAIRRIRRIPKHTEFNVDLKIRITYYFVYMIGNRHYHGVRICVDDTGERCCCCICLEEIEICNVALRMPCKHVFHGGCIVFWLRCCLSCPLCRYQITTY